MEKTAKNIDNYRKGKEPLKNAVMQHPTGNDVYDFLQKDYDALYVKGPKIYPVFINKIKF